MAKRKNNAPAVQRKEIEVTAESLLVSGLHANPEVQTVMEIAMRAREMEALEPALDLDMTTEVRATPVNSQGLWQNPV